MSDSGLRNALRVYEGERATTHAGTLVLEAVRAGRSVHFSADGKATLDPPLPPPPGIPLLTFAVGPTQHFERPSRITLTAPRMVVVDMEILNVDSEHRGVTVRLEQLPEETVLRFQEAPPVCSACLGHGHIGVDCPLGTEWDERMEFSEDPQP